MRQQFNPNIYDYKNLKRADKRMVDIIENVKKTVLNDDVINEYIDSKDISGSTLKSVYHEVLSEFVKFLSERTEYLKVDIIIDKIEGYSENELNQLMQCSTVKS